MISRHPLAAIPALVLVLALNSGWLWAQEAKRAPTTTEQILRSQLQRAQQRGDHPASIDLYRRLRRLAPADTTLVRGLTQVLQATGRHDMTIALLESWLEDHSDDLRAYIDLGQAHHARGRTDRATTLWTHALQQAQGRQWVYLDVSRAQRYAGHLEAATETLAKGRHQLKRGPVFAWELAELHLQRQTIDRAVAEYLNALRTAPGRLGAVESRLLPLARHPETSPILLGALQEGLAAADDPRQAGLLSASCALESGDPELTYQILAVLADRPDVATELFQFAARCYQAGYRQTAIRLYALFVAHGPPSPSRYRALLRRAQIQVEEQDYAGAAATYNQLVHQYPERPEAVEALFHLGRLQLENLHQPDQARDTLQAVVDSAPQSLWGHQSVLLLAECDLRLGQLDTAVERLQGLNAQEPPALFLLAELHYFSADFSRATTQLETLLARAPVHDLANDALDILLRIDTYKNHAQALATLAQAQLEIRQQRLEAAAQRLQALAGDAPVQDLQALALLSLAQLRRQQGQTGRALDLLESLVEEYPDGPYTLAAQLESAQLFERSGDLAQALKTYETALLRFADDIKTPQIRLHIQRLRHLRQEG